MENTTQALRIDLIDGLQELALEIENANSIYNIINDELLGRIFPDNDPSRKASIAYAFGYCVPFHRVLGQQLTRCGEMLQKLVTITEDLHRGGAAR